MHALPRSKGRPVHLIQGYEVWTGGNVREPVHAALRLPNRKIAISEALVRELRAAVGDLGFAVVPNAVDLALFDAPPRERQPVPTVGFIYARSPIKGADRCAAAIALARRVLPALRVLAFGVDRPTPDWPLPPGTEFVQLPDPAAIPVLYARCDAWLFGSRVDSFGLPILEAMACRTPVVGVPVGAAPELLREGGGLLLSDERPDTMAEGLISLLCGPASAWQRVSREAHMRAHSYSWDDATDLLLQALGAADRGAHAA
jgi:glycosyltransferase involved in cell wall biosynthesis